MVNKVKTSALFKDSFWAVFGNGLGNVLLLLVGIIIARLLGKDVYGAYGIAKTTMFQVALFSTFGLGYSATKFIAEYKTKDPTQLRAISYCALRTTILFSLLIGILVFVFARRIAIIANSPDLFWVFRFISFLVFFRAISTVCAGILAGFKQFKEIGINNIISGTTMLLLALPLTYYFKLNGALWSLALSQIVLAVLNSRDVIVLLKSVEPSIRTISEKEIILFSLPIAIQEFSYALFVWASNLLIVRYSSFGEVGIYSACAQWNAVVLMIPNLLYNVVLSYLSGLLNNNEHHKMLIKLIMINFICAFIPFLLVFACSPIIVSLYGDSFKGMMPVLNILIFSTVFYSCANVFYSNLLSIGKSWILCIVKCFRDIITVLALFVILRNTDGINAAQNYAILNVAVAAMFLSVLAWISQYLEKRMKVQNV